jgi:hypothetical protein
LFDQGDEAVRLHSFQRGIHHGKGLLFAGFQLSEAKQGLIVTGIDNQLETSDSLESQDLTLPYSSDGRGQRLVPLGSL